MLTKRKEDGTLLVNGIEVEDSYPKMYNAFLKLHDYESTGLEPDNLGDGYEQKHLYKVFYTDKNNTNSTIYCESQGSAENTVRLLKQAGYDAHMNIWSWHALIEI